MGPQHLATDKAHTAVRTSIATLLFKASPVIGVLMIAVLALTATHAGTTAPSDIALEDIPPTALEAYIAAANNCDGLTWNVLAGIGKVESNHGRVFGGAIDPASGDVQPPIFGAALNGSGAGGNTTPWPARQWEGKWGLTGPWLRALGPMQFISPSWATHGTDANNDGKADPHNIFDATQGSARLLCASQGGEITDIRDALFAYNRSIEYGDLVLHWAQLYVALPSGLAGGTATELLNHPNIELSPRARGDVEAGIIDPRLIATLVSVADDFQIYVGWLKTGHSMCVGGGDTRTRPNCNISNHFYGRAADIGAVGYADGPRPAVTPNNEAARALSTLLGSLPTTDPLRPESLGSPWDTGVFQGHFSNQAHLDHLHVAWRTEPPPPQTLPSTRHGVPENTVTTQPGAAPAQWFPPIILPARPNTVSATPATIHSAVSAADSGTEITLEPGFYPPLRIANKTGITIKGPANDIATFTTGSHSSGAGITIEDSNDITITRTHTTQTLWGISIRRSTNITVAGNTVTDIGQEAVHASVNSSNITIANNTLSHTGKRSGTDPDQGLPYRTFGEGIYIGTGRGAPDSTHNVTIAGNHIHHTSAEAIDLKNGTYDIAVHRNIIHDIATQTSGAIVVHLGSDQTRGPTTITGNLIWGISATSQYRDGNAIIASGPVRIHANLIYDTAHRGVYITDLNSPEPATVTRNVIFDTPMGTVTTDTNKPPRTPAAISDTLDRSIFEGPRFVGGWINNNRPTAATVQLIELLEDPNIPISEISQRLNPPPIQIAPGGPSNGTYTIAQVINGTIGAGDGSNPNEEAPMGTHEAPLYLPQGWNWAQGPTRNAQWGQLGNGGSQFAEWRCAVIPEYGHIPPVPFRINVRNGAYYQYANNQWNKAFDANLIGGNKGGYLGNDGQLNTDPFSAHGHGHGLIPWRQEPDGSYSAPWNPNALFMHFWAGKRQEPAPGQTAEFLTSEMRLQQPDGQNVDLTQIRVLFQCGIDYYNTRGGQGTKVPGPGISKYSRLTTNWRPGLWVTLPPTAPAANTSDFQTWLETNTPPNVNNAVAQPVPIAGQPTPVAIQPALPTGTTPVYDTAWQMFAKATPTQTNQYFETLNQYGFTGTWAAILHHSPATLVDNFNGGGPLGTNNAGQVTLNNDYISRIRAILDTAQQQEQKVGVVVAWQNTYLPGGATETGYRAQVHGSINTTNARTYGQHIATEIGNHPAISMWVFGGDAGHNNTDANKAVWREMAAGVRATGNNTPIAYHTSTSENEQGTYRHLNYVDPPWVLRGSG